jgi:hypothetical protein
MSRKTILFAIDFTAWRERTLCEEGIGRTSSAAPYHWLMFTFANLGAQLAAQSDALVEGAGQRRSDSGGISVEWQRRPSAVSRGRGPNSVSQYLLVSVATTIINHGLY